MTALFPARSSWVDGGRRVVVRYPYTDEEGRLLYEVVRFDPKGFQQRRPDGKGGWRYKLGDVRLVLYRLGEVIDAASRGDVVYVVEGEKDADAMARVGACGTCGPMGAGRWSKVAQVAEHVLTGASIAIVADKDPVGYCHAAEVARSLTAVASSVRVVEPLEGKDASEHFAAGHTVADFVEVAPELLCPEAHGTAATAPPDDDGVAWAEPVPLRAVPELPPAPIDCLPPSLRSVVLDLAAHTATDPAMAAGYVLACLAVACRGRLDVDCGTWTAPVTLYVELIAEPGERKSPVVARLTRPFHDVEAELHDAWMVADRERAVRFRVAEARAKDIEAKLLKGEATVDALLEAQRELAEHASTPSPRLLADDATAEAFTSALIEQGGRLGVLAAEGTFLANVAGRYSDGGARWESLCHAFDGEPIRVDRKGRPAERIARAVAAIGIAMQPEAFAALAEVAGFTGQGVSGRFVYIVAPSNVGWRPLDTPPFPETTSAAWARVVRRLLETVGALEAPRTIALDPIAQSIFDGYRAEIEVTQRPGARLADHRDWAGKHPTRCLTIAALLTVADDPHAVDIGAEAMTWAVEWARWLEGHALAARCEVAGVGPLERMTRRVATWLEGRDVVTLREVHQARRTKAFDTADQFRGVFDRLEDAGYVRRLPTQTGPQGGRPSDRYQVNPLHTSRRTHDSHGGAPTTFVGSVGCVG